MIAPRPGAPALTEDERADPLARIDWQRTPRVRARLQPAVRQPARARGRGLGVLAASVPLATGLRPSLVDLAPTILDYFDLPPTPGARGGPVVSGR